MRAVITGVAGFVGSHLVEALLDLGWDVLGVDCFTPYYDVDRKRANLATAKCHPRFSFVAGDLRHVPIEPLIEGADAVFHQAGQPGVRLSWGGGFGEYVGNNVLATQRLLEAACSVQCPRLVYASSSSVYGNAEHYPTSELDLPRPHSPYGVTKLAAEHLCNLYADNWGLATVALRYFTVYGPRQRPDMAMARLVEAAVNGGGFPVYGDGNQVRDFTFVGDVVRANIAAATEDVPPGAVMNISGGASVTLNEVISVVEELSAASVELERLPGQPGDAQRTGGTAERAHKLLGWQPEVSLREGLARHVEWQRVASEQRECLDISEDSNAGPPRETGRERVDGHDINYVR
ncbi:MAG TPA: NAD-dependent epimerase/dehydratase family protein [Acidimicrobiales bacterium]|nr:NAD-dependent epimerase/dehydratase family protein [Acidimicrobiales bacterium]